ncbi:MAG: hypothetical protein IKL85_06565, partial [Lentisphaeria bacterium]|nr:hypothetical protein [Lentisphaeria bacterium]
MNERGRLGFAVRTDLLALKTDSGVFSGYGGPVFGDDTVVFSDADRHTGYLVPAFPSVADVSADKFERGFEERADETRLKLPRFGLIHLFLDGKQHFLGHSLVNQGISPDNFLQMGRIQGFGELFRHPLLRFRAFSLANGLNQQFFEGNIVESIAQNVENTATKGVTLNIQLLEQGLEDFTLAGFVRDHVPEMTSFRLTDTVNTTETLFQAIRVPWEVVVDHQV